jgi:hypothetical protein
MRAQKCARGGSAESPRINRRLWSEIDRPQYRKARRRFPPAANANKQRFGDKQERAFTVKMQNQDSAPKGGMRFNWRR